MNLVILKGNIVRDVEIKYAASGTAIASFAVAINRVWKNAEGEKQEEVSFINCTAFGTRGENIEKFFRKGNEILVEGYLKQESWEDKESGDKRSAMKVIVNQFHFTRGGTGEREENERPKDRDRDRGNKRSKIDAADVPEGKRKDKDDAPF